jgi:hypothetical protein
MPGTGNQGAVGGTDYNVSQIESGDVRPVWTASQVVDLTRLEGGLF